MKRCGVVVISLACLVAPGIGARAAERPGPQWSLAAPRIGPRAGAIESRPPASVVLIAGTTGAKAAYGCGVIIGEDRSTVTILTAAHTLQIRRATFTTVAGERLRVERTAALEGHDLALVTASRPWRPFEVARFADEPRLGLRVSVWGPIEDEPFTKQDGVVREIDPRVTDAPAGAFAIDCASCGHGDSGTGVFNAREELVGIVVAGYTAGHRTVFVLAERYLPDATIASAPEAPH
jgi:S1-C subfamily serine protease